MRKLFQILFHPQIEDLLGGLLLIGIGTSLAAWMHVDMHLSGRYAREISEHIELQQYGGMQIADTVYGVSFGHPWSSLLLGSLYGFVWGRFVQKHPTKHELSVAEYVEFLLLKGQFQPNVDYGEEVQGSIHRRIFGYGGLLATGLIIVFFSLSIPVFMCALMGVYFVMLFPISRRAWDSAMTRAANGFIKGVTCNDVTRVKRRGRINGVANVVLMLGVAIFLFALAFI